MMMIIIIVLLIYYVVYFMSLAMQSLQCAIFITSVNIYQPGHATLPSGTNHSGAEIS